MAVVFDKPSLWQRVAPLLRGFDWLLLAAVVVLAGLGLLAMYSSGFDHGTRFVDHGRNMLIAAGIMFVVAQVPPRQLMQLAVPVYTLAWRCGWPSPCSASASRGRSAGSTWGW